MVIREEATTLNWAVVVATNSIRGLRRPPCEINFSASFARGKIKGLVAASDHELGSWLHVANDLVYRNRNYFFNGTLAGVASLGDHSKRLPILQILDVAKKFFRGN
jgi:hypothetical protein